MRPPWAQGTRSILRPTGAGRAMACFPPRCRSRHMVYFASLGFWVTGLDMARSGLVTSRSFLDSRKLSAGLILSEMSSLPFVDHSFDCVISVYVLHHSTYSGIRRAFAEIRRVLIPSGLLLALLLSEDDWKSGKGELLERNTCITDEGDEAGVVHHFFSKEGLSQMLSGFSVIELRKEILDEEPRTGDLIRHRHWVVLAEKPC